MSRISVHRSAARGFTLLELMISMSMLAIICAAVISAYLFLGRNLTRLVNTQQQQVKSRRALFQFTQDVGSAIAFTSTTSSNLTFTVPVTLTNCATTAGSATVTCASTAGMLATMAVWTVDPITLKNCSTAAGSATVTCTSTAGMLVGVTVWGAGIPNYAVVSSITNATTFVLSVKSTATAGGVTLYTPVKSIPNNTVVNSITNGTTFVMSANANATTTGATLYTADQISYVYNTSPFPTLTRKDFNSGITTTLLTDIDTSANNGFVYYNPTGNTTTSATNVKSAEFSFTTKVGMASIGTQASYVIVSPRVVVRNKSLLQ